MIKLTQNDFLEHQEITKSLTGWPIVGKYCGLVIDESVRDDDNDWKLYLPMVNAQVSNMVPINDFGRTVVFNK